MPSHEETFFRDSPVYSKVTGNFYWLGNKEGLNAKVSTPFTPEQLSACIELERSFVL